MIGLKLEPLSTQDSSDSDVFVQFHSSFRCTHKRIKKWLERFSNFADEALINDLVLFYSLAKRKNLDHRDPKHLASLILSIYHTRRKLIGASALNSSNRHFVIRWIPADLRFPFSSKPVLGCLIGFNVMDRCELFDEENIHVSLQKHFPEFQFVKESYYNHNSQNEGVRVCYFEVEKRDGTPFSLAERKLITHNFKEKMKNSIQKLIPSMFMKLNQEEVYKNILILSQEITSVNDLPQVSITLDQHTGKEIVFHVTLVQIAPFHRFSFKERILGCSLILDRVILVRHQDGHQVEASLFRLLLPYEPSLIRSDGSLDFYAARQKVSQHLLGAIGEFRDYNGGLLIKQQELLFSFKQTLSSDVSRDPELIEVFFHALVPLEKQALLDPAILSELFTRFVHHRKEPLQNGLSIKVQSYERKTFILVRSNDSSVSETISATIRNHLSNKKDWAYNILESSGEVSFNCVLLNATSAQTEPFISSIQKALLEWSKKRQERQILRIGFGHSMYSLDPRIGGEQVSSEVLRLLFEGLTRLNEDGQVENAVADTISTSPDLKVYTFKLRSSFWNDGSLVSAHDFAYSWKRILSPDFKTGFATLFFPIKNARLAKEGKASSDEVGINVLDDRTLQVELERPIPYFLQLLTLSVFFPIHRFVDKERPQWPYQSGVNYPCNGPFQLKINQPNQAYLLEKNPLYWDVSRIELEQITLSSMDTFQALQAFSRDEIDLVGNPFGAWQPTSIPKQGKSIASPNNCAAWIVFNTKIKPFDNPKLRKALSLAINRKELVEAASYPWTPAYSVLIPEHSDQKLEVFPHANSEKAKVLLKEALDELGLSAKDFSFELTFPQKSTLETAAHILKTQLEKNLGITCNLLSYPWSVFFPRMTGGNFQAHLSNWISPIRDPIYTLNVFKFATHGVNLTMWEDPEYRKILDLSEKEISPFQRSSYFYKAEKILAQNVPLVPLFYKPDQAIIRKDFQIKAQLGVPGWVKTIAKRR